jgi:hypothetical protein
MRGVTLRSRRPVTPLTSSRARLVAGRRWGQEQRKTALQVIEVANAQDLLYISVIWKLLDDKWKYFAQRIFFWFTFCKVCVHRGGLTAHGSCAASSVHECVPCACMRAACIVQAHCQHHGTTTTARLCLIFAARAASASRGRPSLSFSSLASFRYSLGPDRPPAVTPLHNVAGAHPHHHHPLSVYRRRQSHFHRARPHV